MGRPITWQNVNAPSFDGASRSMALAQVGLNSGFDAFNRILQNQQAIDNANWEQAKLNNTEAFYNQMANYKTPEEYQAAVNSGALRDVLRGFGAQIDQAGARKAMDAQMGVLQDRLTKAQQYADWQAGINQRPVEQAIIANAALGNVDQARQEIAANPNLLNLGSLATKVADLSKVQKEEAYKDKLRPFELTAKENQAATSGIQLKEAQRVAADAAEERNLLTLAAKAQQAHRQEMQARDGQVAKIASSIGLPLTSSGSAALHKYDPSQLQKLNAELAKQKLPSALEYLSGDTAKADSFITELEKSGNISPLVIAKNRDALRSFDSTGFSSVGVEAERRKVDSAKEAAIIDEMSKGLWTKPGEAHPLQDRTAVAKLVSELVPEGDRVYANRGISKALTEGIDVTINGKKQKVVPSTTDIVDALSSTDDSLGWSGWGKGGGNFGDKLIRHLQERAKSVNFAEQLKNKEVVDLYRLKSSASDYYSKGTKNNPLDK